MKICPSCHASNNDDAKFCMLCGEELQVAPQKSTGVQPGENRPHKVQDAPSHNAPSPTASASVSHPMKSQEHVSTSPVQGVSPRPYVPHEAQHPQRQAYASQQMQPAQSHAPASYDQSYPANSEYHPSFDFERSQQAAAQTFKKFTGVVPACLQIIDNGRWLAFAGYIQIICLSFISTVILFVFAFGASIASFLGQSLVGSLLLSSSTSTSSKSSSLFGSSSSAVQSSSSGGFTSFLCGIIALIFVGFIIHLAIIRWKSFRGKDASGDERTLRALGLFLRIPSEYVIIVSIGCYMISLITAISFGGFTGFLSWLFMLPLLALWLMVWMVGAFVFGRIIEIMANTVGRVERIEAQSRHH